MIFSSNNDADIFRHANEFSYNGYHNIKQQHDVNEFKQLSSVDTVVGNQQSFISTIIDDEWIRYESVTDVLSVDVPKCLRFNQAWKWVFTTYRPHKFSAIIKQRIRK